MRYLTLFGCWIHLIGFKFDISVKMKTLSLNKLGHFQTWLSQYLSISFLQFATTIQNFIKKEESKDWRATQKVRGTKTRMPLPQTTGIYHITVQGSWMYQHHAGYLRHWLLRMPRQATETTKPEMEQNVRSLLSNSTKGWYDRKFSDDSKPNVPNLLQWWSILFLVDEVNV